MTPEQYDAQPAIERLRKLVKRWNSNNEGMNTRLSLRELLDLDRMWCTSGWDFYPDQWTQRQVLEALRGQPPCWDDRERPTYDADPVPT